MTWIRTAQTRLWNGADPSNFTVVRNSENVRDYRVEVPAFKVMDDGNLSEVMRGSSTDADYRRLPVGTWDQRVRLNGAEKWD